MTTLEAIGFTLAGGTFVLVASLAAFGMAVSARHHFIAPRCTARPKNTIYNPEPTHSCQDRGSPMLGWIPWTLSLTYDTMLRGVPGTGTREGGMSGSLLQVKLDGIVLLRFHTMATKVAALATVLLIGIILPAYTSGQCHRGSLVDEDNIVRGCATTAYNVTNYERTTIANVPSILDVEDVKVGFISTNGILGRLYAVNLVVWIVTAYFCYCLKYEWIEILAMRRVYYLERDLWDERRSELRNTLLHSEAKERDRKRQTHFTFEQTGKHKEEEEKHLVDRDPWIPHPEQRDTVPNIALYSVLVGGLPSLPDQAADAINKGEAVMFSQRESIDWQLSLTAAFFDHCVPNQPGFSSSVAAVTIIPSSKDIALAWRKWYIAAKRLRRLRFIREQISKRRHFDIVLESPEGVNNEGQNAPPALRSVRVGSKDDSPRGFLISPGVPGGGDPELDSPPPIYQSPSRNRDYYRQVLGSVRDQDAERQVYDVFQFGPEQTAVYSREFAHAAAPCCPNGCFEGAIRRAKIDDLIHMEREAAEAVHDANLALQRARRIAVRARDDDEDDICSDDDDGVEQPVATDPADMAAEDLTPAAKSPPSSPPPLVKKESKHRRKVTLDTIQFPEGLQLEATLMQKAASETMKTSRLDVHAQGKLKAKADSRNKLMHLDTPTATNKKDDTVNPVPGRVGDVETGEAPPLPEKENEWDVVRSIVADVSQSDRSKPKLVSSGAWSFPSLKSLARKTKQSAATGATQVVKSVKNTTLDVVDLSRESTYAVVTFTSRQAAVAARHCLADGRGTDRWISSNDLPIPPLADAAAGDLFACKNCCKPVTLSIDDRHKDYRNFCAMMLLAFIYIFYTLPLTAASRLVDPESIEEVFPQLFKWTDENWNNGAELISGLLQSLIWTLFFALCPIMFRAIANFGSGATSAANAEFKALQYFWYFMTISAFSTTLISNMFINGLNNGRLGGEFRTVIREIARTIPSVHAVSWLNWIIFRFTVLLPLNYLLQVTTFLFAGVGFKCCSRIVRGGGPGSPTPYRIYVDSGIVLLCLTGLAPSSPLLAPASLLYFLFIQPVLRRNLIFMYRPKFDGGGFRWPFVFDMCISCILAGQILLITQMILKQAAGPALAAALPMLPTFLFHRAMKKRYLRAFQDASLLQTSLLDGWDVVEDTSMEKREDFRRFLVDSHKAAYVPVCIAGNNQEESLTAEPAVVVPAESDVHKDLLDDPLQQSGDIELVGPHAENAEHRPVQFGATLRRAVNTLKSFRRRHSSSMDSIAMRSLIDFDTMPQPSPFDRRASMTDQDSGSFRRNTFHTQQGKDE